jgi:hypothetical protein
MDGKDNHNPFGGQNTTSSVLVILVISSFAFCVLYTGYRQFHRFWGGHNVTNTWRDRVAPTVDLDQKPVLWDVYIEKGKLEWEWKRSKVSKSLSNSSMRPTFILRIWFSSEC